MLEVTTVRVKNRLRHERNKVCEERERAGPGAKIKRITWTSLPSQHPSLSLVLSILRLNKAFSNKKKSLSLVTRHSHHIIS